MKKIGREDDRDRRITAARQLKEYLKQPENAKVRWMNAMFFRFSVVFDYYYLIGLFIFCGGLLLHCIIQVSDWTIKMS